jgi:hypothetical protein
MAVEPVGLPNEVDARVTRQIEQECPEVLSAWYGTVTGSWWAMVPLRDGTPRLVEAVNPVELRAAIQNPAGWPWPPGWTLGNGPHR